MSGRTSWLAWGEAAGPGGWKGATPHRDTRLIWAARRAELRRALRLQRIGLAMLAIAAIGAAAYAAVGRERVEDLFNASKAQTSAAVDAGAAGEGLATMPAARRVVRSAGIRIKLPAGWRRLSRRGVVAARSRDRSVLIAISAPAPAADAAQLRREAIAAVRDRFSRPKVLPGKGQRIGGVRVSGAVIRGQTRSGAVQSVLVAVGADRRRAYLTEVFAIADASPASLVEAQLVINSVWFRG